MGTGNIQPALRRRISSRVTSPGAWSLVRDQPGCTGPINHCCCLQSEHHIQGCCGHFGGFDHTAYSNSDVSRPSYSNDSLLDLVLLHFNLEKLRNPCLLRIRTLRVNHEPDCAITAPFSRIGPVTIRRNGSHRMNSALFRHCVFATDLEPVDSLGGVFSVGPVGVAWKVLCFCLFV